MGTTLKDNLNSDYIKNFNLMKSRKEPTEILVYVETHDDVAFWHFVFSRFQPERYKFTVLPVFESLDRSGNTIKAGKTAVLQQNTGPYLLGCVDSDYDYLLPERGNTAKMMQTNPYIFQTYTYSIENYQCYAKSLIQLVVDSSNCGISHLDFDILYSKLSKIIYPLFLISIYYYSNNKEQDFSLKIFDKIVMVPEKNNFLHNYVEEFQVFQEKIQKKVDLLSSKIEKYSCEIDKIKQIVSEKGVTEENVYLFIRGHGLFSNITLPILKSICKELAKHKMTTIEQIGGSEKEIKDRKKEYQKSQVNIEDLLRRNKNFTDCFLFKKIESHINNYLSEITKSTTSPKSSAT